MADHVRFSNPKTLAPPPGYSYVVEATGPCRTVYFAGQLGLDLDTLQWPAWVEYLADVDYLPVPIMPGAALAPVSRPRARYLGVNPRCLVRAGSTDSIAAFLAAGVASSGDAVTSLGSTLGLKLLSATRVESGEHLPCQFGCKATF